MARPRAARARELAWRSTCRNFLEHQAAIVVAFLRVGSTSTHLLRLFVHYYSLFGEK